MDSMVHSVLFITIFFVVANTNNVGGTAYFGYYVEGTSHLLSEEVAWSRFGNFKTMHNITYRTAIEDNVAFQRYRDNLIRVEQHNMRYKDGLETYEMYADYPWAAMTEEEFQKRWTGYQGYDDNFEIRRLSFDQMMSIPAEKDWRKESNCIGPIKKQPCGNWCYAYAACTALKARLCIRQGGKVATRPIAEQMYTQCSMKNYLQVEHSLPALLEAVANVGPVAVELWVDEKFEKYRNCGLFQDVTVFDSVNYAMVVVGYTKDALILRNCWGTGWGCEGYMYMERETTARNRGIFKNAIIYPAAY